MSLHGHFRIMEATASKCTKDLLKFPITIPAGKFSDRQKHRKDKFSPGEVVLVQIVTLGWLLGVTVAIMILPCKLFTFIIETHY